MKRQLQALAVRVRNQAQAAALRLFARHELRTTLIAAALTAIAPSANALSSSTDMTDLGAATNFVCLISSYVSGPWLYAIGIVLIVVGAVAIANSESTIGKMLSSVIVGLGLAACAVNIVKDHLGIAYTCA